jgi:acetolactate synthase-1/2/3 large subunit
LIANVKARPRLYDLENCQQSTKPIHPAAAVTALRAAFPRDGIILVDSGAHRAFAGHYWTAYEPRTYISATNLGPMGWAIPAAVGVQCAKPGRRVAVITGDGCMQMHGLDVQTAARYGLPIIYVVLNNNALGNVWLRAHQYGQLPSALTTIPDHDWAGFARALGAQGLTVEDPAALGATFGKALAANTTVLIDVKADKNCPTPVYDFSAGARAWSYHE